MIYLPSTLLQESQLTLNQQRLSPTCTILSVTTSWLQQQMYVNTTISHAHYLLRFHHLDTYHNTPILLKQGGSIYVWEMNRRTLVSEHHDVERKPVVCITGSPMLPIVFFSRASSKDVTGTPSFLFYISQSPLYSANQLISVIKESTFDPQI